ncbi:nuclear transport factor 2 family protein [Streptosporangium sp. DT93]|uniref:nuclear transport factor 2 family protein n=1 Tax=Streptosporangium sp. DT93 TaxID=3393428 RepID=UPI003CF2C02B
MADQRLVEELREAERRLQAAQLAGDVEALDGLLHERLVFTGPPDGRCRPGAKELDLENHRSRAQVLTKVAQEDLTVLVEGRTGVTCFLGTLEGTFAGRPFAGRLSYTRTWVHEDGTGWRILAAHAGPA